MTEKKFNLLCADGHKMPVYGWLPADEPDCVVHIAHGMAEYAERYAAIATWFTQNNIALYAHDQRGHGKAVPVIGDQGITEGNWFYKQIDDIRILIKHLRKEHPNKKIFLLGHSMGSFICQRYFQLYGKEIDGLILSASNGKQDPLMPAGIFLAWLQMKLFGPDSPSNLIDKLSFGKFNAAFKPNRTTNDWLSRSGEEVDKYVSDPQCGFVCSASFFYYFFKGISDAFKKENISIIPTHLPVYAFAGDKDPVGIAGEGFMDLINNWKAAGLKNISYDLYKDGRHEMLNEINREEVMHNLISFIKKNR
ncbi:MAG: lysophospholipase [Gloeobacteraceae cyanobacterium ES-bin-316]|nr:lysophospholipase [Ferruginibacter sp.]